MENDIKAPFHQTHNSPSKETLWRLTARVDNAIELGARLYSTEIPDIPLPTRATAQDV